MPLKAVRSRWRPGDGGDMVAAVMAASSPSASNHELKSKKQHWSELGGGKKDYVNLKLSKSGGNLIYAQRGREAGARDQYQTKGTKRIAVFICSFSLPKYLIHHESKPNNLRFPINITRPFYCISVFLQHRLRARPATFRLLSSNTMFAAFCPPGRETIYVSLKVSRFGATESQQTPNV